MFTVETVDPLPVWTVMQGRGPKTRLRDKAYKLPWKRRKTQTKSLTLTLTQVNTSCMPCFMLVACLWMVKEHRNQHQRVHFRHLRLNLGRHQLGDAIECVAFAATKITTVFFFFQYEGSFAIEASLVLLRNQRALWQHFRALLNQLVAAW